MSTFDPSNDYTDPPDPPAAAPTVFGPVPDSLVAWEDLWMTAVLETKADAETDLGETVYTWTAALTLRCLVQQRVALRRSIEQTGADEGLQVRHTHALYCRLTCTPTDPTPVVFTETQRLRWQDPAGQTRYARVLAASDEGGQQDHYKVLLYEIKTAGTAPASQED
jgi:hypothetical protein